MRRIGIFVVPVVAVVIVGVSLAFALSYIGAEEPPPCRACGQITSEVRQASVCEIAHNAKEFAGKSVLLHGRFQHDSGQFFVNDGGCTMELDIADGLQTCAGAWRKLQVICGVNGWYDGSADVVMVGFISIPIRDDAAGGRFMVSCLEAVLTQPVFSQRVRFALHRLF
jgi:hypothetical protein